MWHLLFCLVVDVDAFLRCLYYDRHIATLVEHPPLPGHQELQRPPLGPFSCLIPRRHSPTSSSPTCYSHERTVWLERRASYAGVLLRIHRDVHILFHHSAACLNGSTAVHEQEVNIRTVVAQHNGCMGRLSVFSRNGFRWVKQ